MTYDSVRDVAQTIVMILCQGKSQTIHKQYCFSVCHDYQIHTAQQNSKLICVVTKVVKYRAELTNLV